MPLAIDPNIALSYKNVDVPDPVAIARQQADTNLTNLQATGQGLQNQQAQAQIANTQRLNQIYAGLFGSSGSGAPGANPNSLPSAPGASVQGSGPNNGMVLTRDPSGLITRQDASQQTPSSGASSVPGQANLGSIGSPQPDATPAAAAAPSGRDAYESVDWSKLPKALAQGGLGSMIPTIMEGVNKYQTGITDLAKKKVDLSDAMSDAAGSLGNTVKQAKYSPQLFLTLGLHALQSGAVDHGDVAPMLQQVFQALHDDPTGQKATALTQQFTDNMIAGSNKQQTLANEGKTAQGAADSGAARLGGLGIKQRAADTSKLAVALSQATTQDGYAAILNAAPHGIASQFPDPSTFDPSKTPQAALRVGTSPEQIVQAGQAASNAAQTAHHNSVEEGQGAQRIRIEAQNASTNRGRLSVEQSNAGLDSSGRPISYTDAQGNPANITPLAKLIGDYKLPPANARGYNTNRGLMNQVIAYNPNFDIGEYEQRYKTMKDLAPSGPLGQQALALNTLVRHSDDMLDAADALNNGNLQAYNTVSQKIAQWTGSPAPTNFDQLRQYVAGETVKLVRGGGGSEADIQAAQANINRANSPAQLAGALRTNFAVAGGKLEALNSAVRTSTHNPNFTALDSGAAELMQKRGYDPNTLKPAVNPSTQSSPSSPGSLPNGNGAALTNPVIVKQFLDAAGGNLVQARALAQQSGWKF